MRRALVLIALVPLAAGCGAAQSREQAVSESGTSIVREGASRLVISYENVFGASQAKGVFDYGQGVGILRTRMGELSGETIVTNDAFYEQLSDDLIGFECDRLGKKRWLKTEYLQSFPFQPDGGVLPTELLEFLSAASDIQRTGAGRERGVEVTRYRARLDVERSFPDMPADERESVHEIMKEYWPSEIQPSDSGIPLDLAIDRDGRLRRVDAPFLDDGTVTVEFFAYGVHVDAKAPPPNEVVTNEGLDELCGRPAAPKTDD